MSIKRIKDLPEGSGSLSNDDIFLFMDNPAGSGVTKKISLSQIASAIGGGGGGGGGGFSFTIGGIDLHNGGNQQAQLLQFDNGSYQSVITGPTPASGNNAQRIIIQGQRAQGNGEGGDVYLWGGDSDTNGGDIKIYAGDADAVPGDGGYVNIEGGSGYANGGNVTLTGGPSSENGGDIRLIAGSDNNGGGEVRITTGNGTKEWQFKNNGSFNLPNSAAIVPASGTIEIIPNSELLNSDQYLIVDPTAPNHIHLRAGGNIDGSNAELIIGGEYSNVKVVDNSHQVFINSSLQSPLYENNVAFSVDNALLYQKRDNLPSLPAGSKFTYNNVEYTILDSTFVRSWAGDPYTWNFWNATTSPSFPITQYNYQEWSTDVLLGFDLTTQTWTFANDGNLSIPGNILLNNGTSVAVGTYDNGTGGNGGISLNCNVGYELNWQGGHLRSSEIGNSSVTQPLFVDSPIQIPGTGVSNMTISASGLTFPDGTSQISAATTGGGLSDSDRYVICKASDDIAVKYAAAKALTPDGSALSASNRATLVIMPGNYTITSELVIDTEFVDVIGLGSIKLDHGSIPAVNVSGGNIDVSANDVRIKGIKTENVFYAGNSLNIIEDCVGLGYIGTGSFARYGFIAAGTYINCIGGFLSFGGSDGVASGTFINCVGGNISFGGGEFYGGNASGTFINCVGGDYSFGGGGGTASGSFKDCSGGYYSFGGTGGPASGSFVNCSGETGSFGGNGGTASGKFLYCTLTTGTFPTLSGTGKYRLCIDGNYDVINADAPPTP